MTFHFTKKFPALQTSIAILFTGWFLQSCAPAIKTVTPLEPIIVKEEVPIVKTGLEVFLESHPGYPGKRVGLMTNQTGVNRNLVYNIRLLKDKVDLQVLFTPEHGLYGAEKAGQKVRNEEDMSLGLTVYSTYGLNPERITPLLDSVDVILFDIQDIGIRAYTYTSSLAYLMRSAAKAGRKVVVFDRPNPINGSYVEGAVLDTNLSSFIGLYPIPYRHGMTVGELARMFNEEFGIHCDLEVIPMQGWSRDMWFDETGLPWVPTSPHVPDPEMILPMITTGIYGELGTLSEGVGTTTPFEIIGGPWISDPGQFARELQKRMPNNGIIFRPMFFKPYYGRHQGQICGGIQIHVFDREKYQPYLTGLTVLAVHRMLYPEIDLFANEDRWLMFDRVAGATWIRKKLLEGGNPSDFVPLWNDDILTFLKMRQKYLLYN